LIRGVDNVAEMDCRDSEGTENFFRTLLQASMKFPCQAFFDLRCSSSDILMVKEPKNNGSVLLLGILVQ